MRRGILVGAAVALLSSCAVTPYDRLRNFEGSEFGYVVASIGKEKSANVFDSTEVLFRLRGTNDRGSFSYAPRAFLTSSGASPQDINSTEAEGTVVAKRLPPGVYDIFVAQAVWHAMGTRIFSRPLSPPLSFSISPGKTTYVGRFTLVQDGYGPASAAELKLTDEHVSDLARAKSRVPSLNIEEASILQIPSRY